MSCVAVSVTVRVPELLGALILWSAYTPFALTTVQLDVPEDADAVTG